MSQYFKTIKLFPMFSKYTYVTYTLLYCVKKNNYINHVIKDIKIKTSIYTLTFNHSI